MIFEVTVKIVYGTNPNFLTKYMLRPQSSIGIIIRG